MKKVTLTLDDHLYEFYREIGRLSGSIAPEQVMADTLYKLAGELAHYATCKEESK